MAEDSARQDGANLPQTQAAADPGEDERLGVGRVISEMPMGRRLMLSAAGALLLAGIAALFLWINQPNFVVLYSNLTQEDASKIVNKLKEMKVEYLLDNNGTTVKVQEDQVYETRLAMAADGLPTGGTGVGFEVFNDVPMGTTEFVQRINYQRALQGELARTISSFNEVLEARVHIVLPRESLFVEEEKKPSAAVVVQLAAGKTLAPSQIAGIVNLVASSVPDLTDERVTIVDTRGNLLYQKRPDTDGFPAALTASQLEYQRHVERTLSSKVESMLERVLGPGRAVVRVAADIDFTRTSTTETEWNPEQVAVRSETTSSDKSKNQGMPIGSPDQRFTLARANSFPNEVSGGSEANREDVTTNFEVSNTKVQKVKPVGGIKKLDVAVMVDGPYKEATTAEGATTRSFEPRTAEEMRQITEIVRRAVGYDNVRGDEVTVANVPFQIPDLGTIAGPNWEDYVKQYGRLVVNVLLAILFFLLVVRPMVKVGAKYLSSRIPEPTPPPRPVGPEGELPAGEDEEAQLLEEALARKMSLRDQVLALVQQDPDRAVAIVRAWIHELE
ncbi:MAG: flagellar M-ring protein FliF [Deltaproteobacteria bacterium]|nr:flagellar M-ring protein FliF [Deltaproteobacteria bacterium]